MAEKIKAKAGRHGQALSVWMAALLLFISIFLTAPLSVRAQEADSRTGSLHITASYEADTGRTGQTQDRPVSGMAIRLYRTADLVEKDGSWIYESTKSFSSIPVSYNQMTASQSASAAKKLAQTAADLKPDAQGVTGSDGTLTLDGLAPGMYLAVQKDRTGNVIMDPCLWQLPQPVLDEKTGAVSLQYQAQVRPKTQALTSGRKDTPPSRTHKTPTSRKTAVKTGDPSSSPLPYMISAAAALAAVILLIVQKRREGQE